MAQRGRPAKPIVVLTDDEEVKLLNHADDDQTGAGFLIRFLLNTGLRIGEARHVVWADLMTYEGPRPELTIQPEWTKNKVGRRLPIASKLANIISRHHSFCALKTHDKVQYDFPVLPGFRTKGWSIRRMQNIIQQLGQEACGRRITPHVMRHTFATRLLKVCDIRTIQILLGHIFLNSTQIYTHPSTEDLRKAMEKL